MPSKYWIKLYHEILNDFKMAKMSDRLFRRTIEVFLLAGDYEKDGLLPPTEDMAWRLRLTEEELETDLIELQQLGIVTNDGGQWSVHNFPERQGPMTEAERSRRRRQKRHMLEYQESGPADVGVSTTDQPPTDRKRDRKAVTDKDIDKDIDKKGAKAQSKSSNKKPQPEAIKTFRIKAHRFPAKSWWELIDETVGDAEKDLELWGEIVFKWVGLGWNPMNVAGMLEFYQRREMPSVQHKYNEPPHRSVQSTREFLDELRST